MRADRELDTLAPPRKPTAEVQVLVAAVLLEGQYAPPTAGERIGVKGRSAQKIPSAFANVPNL